MAQFKYHNANPYRIEEEDCVCRSLSKALKLSYEVVGNLLMLSATHNKCDTLCVCCYHYLLEDIFNLPVRYCDKFERVNDICDAFEDNTLLIRIDGHLTMYDGKTKTIYDLWDCRQRFVDCFWIVE